MGQSARHQQTTERQRHTRHTLPQGHGPMGGNGTRSVQSDVQARRQRTAHPEAIHHSGRTDRQPRIIHRVRQRQPSVGKYQQGAVQPRPRERTVRELF